MDSEQRVPLKIVLGDVTDKNIQQLRLLNAAILPVRYQEKFYESILKQPPAFVRSASYNDVVIAAVACRKEPRSEEEGGGSKLYIMTLGVLAPYREHGVGTQLIQYVLKLLKSPTCNDVKEVFAHVHTENETAVDFYKKYGFQVTATIPNYYKGIEPPDCYYMQKLPPFDMEETEEADNTADS